MARLHIAAPLLRLAVVEESVTARERRILRINIRDELFLLLRVHAEPLRDKSKHVGGYVLHSTHWLATFGERVDASTPNFKSSQLLPR